jgi:signal transduction histidine kinase
VRATFRALLLPRRLIAMVVVSLPLVAAQAHFSPGHEPLAVPLAIAMCVAFVLVAPLTYRVLFPEGLDFGHGAIRVLMFGTISAGVVLTIGAVVPKVTDMGDTLLTERYSLIVCAALFVVGGWGLGRDIEMERSLAREKARSAVLTREAERAQLLALRAHLDPHFLFNTLNAIAEWCREDGETAERAVLQLSSMLRAVLAGVRAPSWSMADELDLARTLLSLHLLRDPDRFRWRVEAPPEVMTVQVPPMVLLPLAENAVKHGPAAGHRGEIAITASLDGEWLRLRIASPGPYGGPRRGSDGLPTLERRIEHAYDGRARFAIRGEGQSGAETTVAELTLLRAGPAEGAHA